MKKRNAIVLFSILGVFSRSQVSQAAIIDGTYRFSASGFTTGAPINPVIGSVNIEFNNSQDYSPQSSGISLTSNVTPSSTLEFEYQAIPDILIIGGAAASVTNSDPASVDFALFIQNASTSPTVSSFTYSVGSGSVYVATVESVTFAVPEPASMMLLGGAVMGMTTLRKRKPRIV